MSRLSSAARRPSMLAALAAGLAWLLWISGAMDPLERPISDLLLRFPRPGALPPCPFAAVVIDDASVEDLGPLPWPRSRLASLVDGARGLGARAVVLDILLSEPGQPSEDQTLEASLAALPSVLVALLAPDGSWLLPLDRFGGARQAAHGHAEIASDGVVRSISMTKQAGGLSLPALSVAAASLAGWQGSVEPGRLLLPDYRRRPGSLPQLGAHELLAGHTGGEVVRDRVVWIGVTASGAGDQLVVPVASRDRPTPGVLVHVAVADALARGGLLRPSPPWLTAALAVLLSGLVQWARTRSGRMGPLGLGLIGLLAVAATVGALWAGGLQLPVVTLVTAVVLAAAAREITESADADRETAAVLESLIVQQDGAVGPEMPAGVSGRLQLARALQQQIGRDRDLRRTLLEGLEEGVVLWDQQGQVLLANQALTRLWGGLPTLETIAGRVTPPEPVTEGESMERERHGRSLSIQLRPLTVGTLGLVRDTTAERELERQRRETQRLVSHELKTPLASISGFGAMLERYELDRDEQLRVAGLIRSESDRLGSMVATFLDLERIGSGRLATERTPLDLAALAARRCDLLEPVAAQRSQQIHMEAGRDTTVVGSQDLLERLVDNLVSNALKYSPAGRPVRVTVEERSDGVALAVADQGHGIPEEALPHLFERFFRVPGEEQSGTGLGLALVHEIASWHGAEVLVDSSVGHGSTFTVLFPHRDERSEADGGDGAGG